MLCFANSLLPTIIPAPLKNAIDWASRPPNVWADKAAAIVSAGGGFGGGRSQYHLRQIGIYLDLHFINKPEFFLNAFQPPAKFDGDGNLIDESVNEKLKEVLISLQAFTLRLQGKQWISGEKQWSTLLALQVIYLILYAKIVWMDIPICLLCFFDILCISEVGNQASICSRVYVLDQGFTTITLYFFFLFLFFNWCFYLEFRVNLSWFVLDFWLYQTPKNTTKGGSSMVSREFPWDSVRLPQWKFLSLLVFVTLSFIDALVWRVLGYDLVGFERVPAVSTV